LPLSMPITTIGQVGFLRHGVLLVLAAPSQLRSLVKQERGRSIPLPDFHSVGHLVSVRARISY
jgi:hypothetical protein